MAPIKSLKGQGNGGHSNLDASHLSDDTTYYEPAQQMEQPRRTPGG